MSDDEEAKKGMVRMYGRGRACRGMLEREATGEREGASNARPEPNYDK